MVQLFQILAVILAGVAAFFYLKEYSDWAFASGVLACCSFFLSLRSQFRARIKERDIERSVAAGVSENMENKDDKDT